MNVTPSIAEAAKQCLGRGWSVVPVQPRAKRPIIKWLAFQHVLASPADVDAWFARWPDANAAVVTGALSGLVVVDVDPAHGGDESLAVLEREFGPLPETVECRTGGGGRHLYFRHPGKSVGNRAGLRPGIDVRGDGGCIVIPPSVHPSGRRYAWAPGRSPAETALAPLPGWVLRPRGAGPRDRARV